jgi:endonuclease YncB( thermonuclease family)
MKRDVSSSFANIALAVGVTVAVAVAVGFAVGGWNHAGVTPPAVAPKVAGAAIELSLPAPAPKGATPPATSARATPPVIAVPTADALATTQPFEPPAPPIATVAPVQVAALPGAGLRALQQGAAAPIPALRTTALETVPPPTPRRPRPAVGVPHRAPPPSPEPAAAREPVPPQPAGAAPFISQAALDGPGLRGDATVTGPLELNVEGRLLRLYGLAPPEDSDMCSPGEPFAARSCAEVARQALAKLLAGNSQVTCRVLATGGGVALPAVCADRDGSDLGLYLVSRGFALAESNDTVDYSPAQKQAKAKNLGLWQYR